MGRPARCVVVGAGLAGLRAAESLVRHGFEGEVAVLGDETLPPYSRPPLSKEALAGSDATEAPLFRTRGYSTVTWHLGTKVARANLREGTVTTARGRTLEFDGLVVASGVRPRRLVVAGPERGRLALRSYEDLRQVRKAVKRQSRVVIIGAGFLGCEIASTLARRGLTVDVVMREPAPMASAVGEIAGQSMRDRLERTGARFHRADVLQCKGSARVEAVDLSTGQTLPTDLVIEAVGSVPNTEWLEGNGLDLTSGVTCASDLRVLGTGNAVACGDIAAVPYASGPATRIEHWAAASDTGNAAGATLAHLLNGTWPQPAPALLPTFWSDQAGIRIQGLGMPSRGIADVRVLEGELHDRAVLGYHGPDGALTGVVLINAGDRQRFYRDKLLAA